MAQALRQYQKLTQKLSPQQIQLMKLLQVPTMNLEERIDMEIQENPALEYNEEKNNMQEDSSVEKKTGEIEKNDDVQEYDGESRFQDAYEEVDVNAYLGSSQEIDGYNYKENYYDRDADDEVAPQVQFKLEQQFSDFMRSQIELMDFTPHEKQVAEFIIGSLEEDGYLRRDIQSLINDLAFRQNIQIDERSLMDIIDRIKTLEPAGVCATDLRECLMLQLKRKEQRETVKLAMKVLEKYFEEFSKKHYERIMRGLNIEGSEMKEVISEIIKLNPKPGGEISGNTHTNTFLIPDFTALNDNGNITIHLNSKNAPELRISNQYMEMLKGYNASKKKTKEQNEAILFIKQKIDSAKWFIDAIKQRQNTLKQTMNTIVKLQREFFISGDELDLKPMILKDVSDRTGFDISTVSRVVNSKFVETEFGTFKLKYFFSESLSTQDGDDVSTKEVKKVLSDFIEQENKKKPLSDEKLTQMLTEKGYNIARRTVAKYREQLNIPVARLRKAL